MVIIDLIYPKKCLECGRPGKYICGWCLRKVPKNYTSFRFAGKFSKEIYLWHYAGVVRKAIIALKYKFARQVAQELAQRAAFEIKKRQIIFPKDTILVPIPASVQRRNWRGFNQTELVGKVLATKCNVLFEPGILVKTKNTPQQVKLGKVQRIRNVQGSISLNQNLLGKVQGKTVILFDDVLTTGSTILEAEKTLINNRLKQIRLLVLTF